MLTPGEIRLHNVTQSFVFVLQIHFVGTMMLPRLLPQLLALGVSSVWKSISFEL
jgi:hypothetical protein